ncbi:MAG: MFS transporter, partial [Candidatus Thermoplasmatota archaeon]|nr:MFS transporter [Candidatus Thermoplasmatota archaeon]
MGFMDKTNKTIKGYPAQYWIVISLELLERGAYYGIMGYFPVHLVRNLGFTGFQYGVIYASLLALLYTVPILASSLARKFGYRKILLLAFIMLAPTYFIMTFVESYWAFFPLIIAWGIGAGAFKPMVSATIAHVTEKEHRNSAYSIYYLSINWGSLLAMVAIGILVPEAFAHIAFAIGAVLITINLLTTFFLYKDPVERQPDEKISNSIKNIFLVLSDRKFALLLLIYAGFFFVFSSLHTFLPVYYTEFGLKPFEKFEAPLMAAINPLTIVALGPFLSRFMDRFQSLRLMITGMFVFSMGLFLLGMFPAWYTMMIGIFIFSIGEFMTHPNFISYVSKVAPEEKVALYMGFAFIPSAIGNVSGSLAGGILWDKIAVAMEQPSFFWAIYVGIGLFTIGNFLIYNRFISGKKDILQKKNFFNHKLSFLLPWMVIPIIIIAGSSWGTLRYIGSEDENITDQFTYELSTGTKNFDGYLDEGGSIEHLFTLEENNIAWVNITLTWVDEPDQQLIIRSFENQPDTFRMTYEPSNSSTISDSKSNPMNSEGVVVLSHSYSGKMDYLNGTGQHSITIELSSVGDYEGSVGLGFLVNEDTGNDYNVRIEYSWW